MGARKKIGKLLDEAGFLDHSGDPVTGVSDLLAQYRDRCAEIDEGGLSKAVADREALDAAVARLFAAGIAADRSTVGLGIGFLAQRTDSMRADFALAREALDAAGLPGDSPVASRIAHLGRSLIAQRDEARASLDTTRATLRDVEAALEAAGAEGVTLVDRVRWLAARTEMHPTTVALLAAVDAWDERWDHDEVEAVWDAACRWDITGCPGLAPPPKVPLWVVLHTDGGWVTLQGGDTPAPRCLTPSPGIHVQSGASWRAPTAEELGQLARGEVVCG